MPKYRGVGSNMPRTCSKPCQSALRSAVNRATLPGKCGGKRHGSGRGKKGYYNGIWCDSTYELAYLIYCMHHKIDIQRYKGWFDYFDENGKKRRYYPDFLVNGRIVEIKGYLSPRDYRKLAAVNQPVELLTKTELREVFEYVETTTGLTIQRIFELYD